MGRPPITDWRQHSWWKSKVAVAYITDFDPAPCWVWGEPDVANPKVYVEDTRMPVRRYLWRKVRGENLTMDEVVASGPECQSQCINPHEGHAIKLDRAEWSRQRYEKGPLTRSAVDEQLHCDLVHLAMLWKDAELREFTPSIPADWDQVRSIRAMDEFNRIPEAKEVVERVRSRWLKTR